MKDVYLGLGGNVGNVAETLAVARNMLEADIGSVIRISSLYKTEPWGNKEQHVFLNQVVCLQTLLTPKDVLKKILEIEKKLGRSRDKDNQFGPRTIDIDILFLGDEIVNEGNLVIPHPRLHLRNFVLTPLHEIAPELVHPLLHQTVSDLLQSSTDESSVIKA